MIYRSIVAAGSGRSGGKHPASITTGHRSPTRQHRVEIAPPLVRLRFLLAAGMSPDQILSGFPDLAPDDVRAITPGVIIDPVKDYCRARFPGAERYWEGRVELDLVAPDPDDPKGLLVAEVKWRQLSVVERDAMRRNLETRWERCSLRAQYRRVRFDVLDASILRPRP